MELAPLLLTAKVMHKRFFPKVNSFNYGVYYVALPLPFNGSLPNSFMSFKAKDYGLRDGSCPYDFALSHLKQHGLEVANLIYLVTMPRIFGYGFNPVSFYLCHDDSLALRAVICEVHNTFNETYSYICFKADKSKIGSDELLIAHKLFHVSPFIERVGHYSFRFNVTKERFGAWINYFDCEGKMQLVTGLTGQFEPLTTNALKQAFWQHPLVTLKVISLIHYQAVKLFLIGIKVIPQPKQLQPQFSTTIDDKPHV